MTTKTDTDLTPLQTELLSRADAILDNLAKTVGQAKDYALEQIPDIALQYVAWGRAYLTVHMVLATILIVTGLWLSIRVGIMNSRNWANNINFEDKQAFSIIFGVIMVFVGGFVFLVNMKVFMMVWFAPKIWLITEIVHLVKQ